MTRSLAGFGLWIAATAAATGLVFLAVNQVGDVATSQPVVQPAAASGTGDTPSSVAVSQTATTTTDVGGHPPTTQPGATTTTPHAAPTTTESYVLVGGTVAVTYSPTSVKVAWATPLLGYSVSTRQVSPTRIEVVFTGIANRSRLDAWWDGAPRHTITNV